ncbi:hypothetical protein [Luteimonas sp. MC1572]|uniref:hypothetical protein n=1 Tax=Luteimonas sp. MC1572 TaxID=2799325 RepID=UPI0018F06A95|nr:hypothetical protein [Luteimonas sp. MC1572]MBJ6980739.1 hypothetical protein [Luteimonas sp. MC1572]QQO02109.1 hypothetical protein JGR64_07690 [Luteimonas sp. MC1572]
MRPTSLRDDAAPWSFFLPVMLAVAVGMLLAGAVQFALKTVFAPGPSDIHAAPVAVVASGDPDGDVVATADEAEAALVAVGAAQGGDVVLLPGPITSMREGSDRACINDTIALRRPNGWEQGLENDAPLRCRASSP